jgi:hypothetical protein
MTFADELTEVVKAKEEHYTCSVCVLLASLPESDADALRAALSSKVGYRPLAKIIRKNGYTTSDSAIMGHRSERHGV